MTTLLFSEVPPPGKPEDYKVANVKRVWIVVGETVDEEQGRSHYPRFVCESEATALRLAEEHPLAGEPSVVREGLAFRIKGLAPFQTWYTEARILPPTKEDEERQVKMDSMRAALQAAKAAGLAEEHLVTVGRAFRKVLHES